MAAESRSVRAPAPAAIPAAPEATGGRPERLPDRRLGRSRRESASGVHAGLSAECGWSLAGIEVPADGQASVTGTFDAAVVDEAELQDWLAEASCATSDALMAPETSFTAYPVQRLQDVSVRVPACAVSQTSLEAVLLPVWPGGADEVNPLLKSPSAGASSQMLQSVAGDGGDVRFAKAARARSRSRRTA